MSRLPWVEKEHGWRAGPHEIEFVAPHLWICTRRSRNGTIRIEATSGSLSALKARVEWLDARQRSLRKMALFTAVFLLGMFVSLGAVMTSLSYAPAIVVGFSVIGLWAGLKAVDCMIQRSWESLRLNYQ